MLRLRLFPEVHTELICQSKMDTCRLHPHMCVQILSSVSQIAQNDSRCFPRPEWGAFICFGTEFAQLLLTALDAGAYSSSSAPLTSASQDELSAQILVQELPPFQVRLPSHESCGIA